MGGETGNAPGPKTAELDKFTHSTRKDSPRGVFKAPFVPKGRVPD
jgi:hypothetical protein